MKEIENREDVRDLVYTFYGKIQKDAMLGPIFNERLDGRWDPHLEKMTDFWETNLFGVAKFRGNPALMHGEVDRDIEYGVTQEHFAQWIYLWFETINEKFEGKLAERAKNGARKMSTALFMAIWNQRPENSLGNYF